MEEVNAISMRASDGSIVKIEYHKRLDSASALAREYAKQGYPDRYAVVCEYESSRDGDSRGIYISCILRPSIFPAQAGLLSSLAAVAFATGLEAHSTKKMGIGWVSNIYCEGKPIGSATIEGMLDNFTTYEYILVNFSAKLSDEDFPNRISDLVKKVFEADNESVTAIIAKSVLNRFFPFYSNLRNNNKYMNIYKQKFVMTGVKIKLIIDGKNKKETCRIIGIDPDYCTLLVERKNGSVEAVKSPTKVIIPKYIKASK